MAWPPPVLPINRTNADPQQDTHPNDHNALALAMNDTVTRVIGIGDPWRGPNNVAGEFVGGSPPATWTNMTITNVSGGLASLVTVSGITMLEMTRSAIIQGTIRLVVAPPAAASSLLFNIVLESTATITTYMFPLAAGFDSIFPVTYFAQLAVGQRIYFQIAAAGAGYSLSGGQVNFGESSTLGGML